jgi:hypothetical protein
MSSSNNDSDSDSDTDYYSDSDEDEEYNEIVYEQEEPSKTRFNIALCELFNNRIHGPGPNGHYLTYCKYKKLHLDWMNETADFMSLEYQYLHNQTHDLFPNYRQIVLGPHYIKPEIVECFYKDGFCIAIIKTFWIKIVQRTWKKIFEKRQIALKNRENIMAIRDRELNGKWPANCYASGGLIGLLTI